MNLQGKRLEGHQPALLLSRIYIGCFIHKTSYLQSGLKAALESEGFSELFISAEREKDDMSILLVHK